MWLTHGIFLSAGMLQVGRTKVPYFSFEAGSSGGLGLSASGTLSLYTLLMHQNEIFLPPSSSFASITAAKSQRCV